MVDHNRTDKCFDIIGAGFGPMNLALAAMLDDEKRNDLQTCFFERKPEFSWHSAMLLPGVLLQTPFMLDIATPRNPRSRYTFLNYLWEEGRLEKFINIERLFPPRIEFNAYLRWCADLLANYVRYGATVESIAPGSNGRDGSIETLILSVRTQEQTVQVETKNLVLGIGTNPYIPPTFRAHHPKVLHSSSFLDAIPNGQELKDVKSVVIVGGGQSSAEILRFFMEECPETLITVVARGYIYKPTADTAFTREHELPSSGRFYACLSEDMRRQYANSLKDTNYSVADAWISEEIAERIYDEASQGKNRVRFLSFSEVVSVEDGDHHALQLNVRTGPTENVDRLTASLVVLATGYDWSHLTGILMGIEQYLVWNGSKPVRSGDYALRTTSDLKAKIFAHHVGTFDYGVSETFISTTSGSAKRILDSIRMAK